MRGTSSPRFIGGANPAYLDVALYGQLQMIFSGLSETFVEAVMARPRLLRFITDMNGHERLSKYAHNFCSRLMNNPHYSRSTKICIMEEASCRELPLTQTLPAKSM